MESARELLNSALDMPLDEGLAFESAMGEQLTETDDYTEGFTARIEGREPEFEGE
jgi:enoyl-CoA hydratase/carnithine racemase